MPSNPNAHNVGGITFLHEEPSGAREVRDIPPVYWPDTQSIIAFNVTGRRTLEVPPEKAYILAMYHVALLNTLLTLGASDDRERWQDVRVVNDYMEAPEHGLVRLSPTALARTIDTLDYITIDAASGESVPFIERSDRGKGAHVGLRIHPGIGLSHTAPQKNPSLRRDHSALGLNHNTR